MQINDGTGRGYSAKVSENGRVSVDADDGALAGAAAGTLYAMGLSGHSSRPTITMTSTGGVMMYLSNTDGAKNSLCIDSIQAASGAVGTVCKVVLNYVEGSLADEEQLDIISTNSSYAATIRHASASGYSWDENGGTHGVGGLTEGVIASTTILAAGGLVELVPSGRYIVRPGGSISVHMVPATGTPEIAVAMRFYDIDAHKGY